LTGESSAAHEAPPVQSRRWGIGIFVIVLAPALAAIWGVSLFVTQDGPAHLYNAHILHRSLSADSPFRPFYTVRWEPLPNWAGHLATMGLVSILPARQANRVVLSVTLVGFVASIAWLRLRVAGWRGMPLASCLATLLSLNMTWLFGFTSFLLGACLFAITLGVWWGGRERPRIGRAAFLAVLLVCGYFAHLVSLGLTVVGLTILTALTPGERRLARAGMTAASLIPLVPLGLFYLRLSGRGGPLLADWEHRVSLFSIRSWVDRLGWVDPISLASRLSLPFLESKSWAFGMLAPVVLSAAAMAILVASTLWRARGDRAHSLRERRGWLALAALLLLGGLAGPDSLGTGHGHYLPQRLSLLGLVALVPALDLDLRRTAGRAAGVLLAGAIVLQSAFVWDYALTSTRTVGGLMRARAAVGHRQRVAVHSTGIGGRFRANPLLHAGNLFGIGTGNVIWNNYETAHYYFPVQRAGGIEGPSPIELEWVALHDDPRDAEERAERWHEILRRHHPEIDRLVVWDTDPELDAISARFFLTVFQDGRVRVMRPRLDGPGPRERSLGPGVPDVTSGPSPASHASGRTNKIRPRRP